MSAALQLPTVWAVSSAQPMWIAPKPIRPESTYACEISQPEENGESCNLAFYRKHTEKMLRRYLYASMQVGRAPSALTDSVGRGWVSSRPVKTFEDAVIFVLDIERCLHQLPDLDLQLLTRIVMQEYTQAEAADLLGMSVRSVCYKFPRALDRLTQMLLDTGLLILQ